MLRLSRHPYFGHIGSQNDVSISIKWTDTELDRTTFRAGSIYISSTRQKKSYRQLTRSFIARQVLVLALVLVLEGRYSYSYSEVCTRTRESAYLPNSDCSYNPEQILTWISFLCFTIFYSKGRHF
jgi:hypothetical protein